MDTLFFKPVTEKELIDIVVQCKSKSSLDKDYISVTLIKSIIIFILKFLVYIFNFSLKSGVFPNNI